MLDMICNHCEQLIVPYKMQVTQYNIEWKKVIYEALSLPWQQLKYDFSCRNR